MHIPILPCQPYQGAANRGEGLVALRTGLLAGARLSLRSLGVVHALSLRARYVERYVEHVEPFARLSGA